MSLVKVSFGSVGSTLTPGRRGEEGQADWTETG